MKILHIAPIGPLPEGIGTVLINLVPRQQALGNQVRIITQFDKVMYKDVEISTVKSLRLFKRYISNWRPDIVIIHSLYEMCYLMYANYLYKEKIPYLVQMHGALSESNYKKNHLRKVIANYLFFNTFLRRARGIIYLNKAEYKNCIVKELNPNYYIIPNGCEKANGFELSRPVGKIINIIFVGRIVIPHKGLDVLVDSIRILKEKGVNDIFISFYGSEKELDVAEFKNLIKGMGDITLFKGGVYGKDKADLYCNSDLFILTSRYEGMPMGLLEALSYGIPCIVTPGTNMSEEVKNAGAGYVASFNAESIAETIEFASKDYRVNYERIRHKAYSLSKLYDWDTIAGESIKVLNSCIKNS